MNQAESFRVFIFLMLVLAVYGLETLLLGKFLFNKINKKPPRLKLLSKPAIVLHCLAFIGILCFSYGYFVEPYWVKVNTIEITTHKLQHTSLRIVQISDLHCDRKIRNEPKLAKLINPLNPDIIVFTGDALNAADTLPVFKETLKGLKASLGKFAIRGNFDVWYWGKLDLFSNTGFQELTKDSVELTKDGEVFYVSGLSCAEPSEYTRVLQNIPADKFSIFLYHYPDRIENLGGLNVDLYLCGHTHGGQIALPLYGAIITLSKHGKKYESGRYQAGRTTLYVNQGIGMEGGSVPRVRFWARPEITVFEIK